MKRTTTETEPRSETDLVAELREFLETDSSRGLQPVSRALKSLAIFFAFVAIFTLSRHTGAPPRPRRPRPPRPRAPSTTTTSPRHDLLGGSDFQGVFNQGQGAAGTIYASVTLTKTTSGCVHRQGLADLDAAGPTGGGPSPESVNCRPERPDAVPDAGANQAPTKLTLHHGSTTTFSLAYSDVPTGNTACESATTINVQFTVAGTSVPVTPPIRSNRATVAESG